MDFFDILVEDILDMLVEDILDILVEDIFTDDALADDVLAQNIFAEDIFAKDILVLVIAFHDLLQILLLGLRVADRLFCRYPLHQNTIDFLYGFDLMFQFLYIFS